MGLFKMTMRRVQKVIAWVLAVGIIALLALGVFYIVEAA